jgi:arginase
MKDQFILSPYFLDQPLPALEALLQPGWQLNAAGSADAEGQARISALHEPLAARVAQVLQSGDRPISIAGDCCTVIAVAAGMRRAGIDHTLLWFDAHGDFNTWETTPSGFLGGMPLAMLVGRGEQTLLASLGLQPLSEDRVILTDGRDLDPGERRELDRSKVTRLRSVTDLLTFTLPDAHMLVHFDTDVLDPAYAPAMDYPAPGGPTPDELGRVFSHLASTGKVRAVSVSTWNPSLDENGETRNQCMRLLRGLLGG